MAQLVKNLSARQVLRRADSIPGPGRSPGGRKWQPTPVFLPKKSHGQRIQSHGLVGYSPKGPKESDTAAHRAAHTEPHSCRNHIT